MKSESREDLLGAAEEGMQGSGPTGQDLDNILERPLTQVEKSFLLQADRGDVASVKQLIEQYHPHQPDVLDINCVDPLNRSALVAAIENENIELIRLLLEVGIEAKDALLHAIKEEYVEAVEVLLQWEEEHHVPGDRYSWERVEPGAATFTPDITPLVLAAHRNHYEILKILLDRGATLPVPHDGRCGCDECVSSSTADSLRHSRARINAYRALTAPSLIALSASDPLLCAFELSWELKRLTRLETEFRADYKIMREQCQEFVTSLLDHTRTSNELETMLNYNPLDLECWEPGERQTLGRLKLAIKYKQKMFVAHPNVQQLLGAIWYEGLPGFRRKSLPGQALQVLQLGAMFPVYSMIYMMAPTSETGRFMKKPFVKFICYSSSYMFFLSLLCLASQRAEYVVIEWVGWPWLLALLDTWKKRERGALPGIIEFSVVVYVVSLIWGEIRSLWSSGFLEYVQDLWNIVDFITNIFYIAWIFLRVTSWWIVQRDAARGLDPWYPRESWDPYDPMLLSEGAFAAGMIFSFLKLVHIFSINPHLGPLQVSLGRMILDIIKFFFIYSLVLFAFGCGLNQLMWYYADLEKNKCYHLPSGLPDFDTQEKACSIWRRYANLFETSQSLFWASFGLVDLMTFDLTGIKDFTRFWALLTFGSYSVINVIVLLNMLIAMMSNSYQIISERSDMEWKFARSNLWISYFDEGDTVPPPFNLFPTPKNFVNWMSGCGGKRTKGSVLNKCREKARLEHERVMRVLVRRYVTSEQRKRDEVGITEDDVMEIRQDIGTLRFELIDILRNNGMKTPKIGLQDTQVAGKKGRVMERRILKDFQIGIVEGIINEVISKDSQPKDVFGQIAKAIGRKASTDGKKDWNAVVRQSTLKRDPIGSRSEAQIRRSRQSLRVHILDNVHAATIDPEKLLAYNPNLSNVTPTTRVAYAKFMKAKIKSEYDIRKEEKDKEAVTKARTASSASLALEDEVFESPKLKRKSIKFSDTEKPDTKSLEKDGDTPKVAESKTILLEATETQRDFRSRSPIPEASDEEQLAADDAVKKFEVEADIEDQRCATSHSEESAQTHTSKSALRESTKHKTPSKESSIKIKLPDSETKTKIDIEPDYSVSKPLHIDSKSEIPMSISATPESPPMQSPSPSLLPGTTSGAPTDSKTPSTAGSPVKTAKVSPAPNVTGNKGKSKITGKTITGWI